MNNSGNKLIWVACLSKRGGGIHLLHETEKILKLSNFSTLSLVSVKGNSTNVNYKVISTPSLGMRELSYFLTFPIVSFSLFYKSRKKLPSTLVQIMPSPMDYWLDVWCLVFGVKIFRAIHDFQPHPGEVWPTKLAIKRRIGRADSIFVFSSFVLNKIQPSVSKKIFKCSLPGSLELQGVISPKLRDKLQAIDRPLVLFIGRIKKYKGLDFLLETVAKYPRTNFSILIAGSGLTNYKKQKDVHYWNHWLTESEIDFLLTEASVVVFPYLEASQSGVVPLAIKKNKVILATTVGSLEEQLDGYQRKVLVAPGNSKSLLEGLEISICLSTVQNSRENILKVDQSMSFGDVINKVLIGESDK